MFNQCSTLFKDNRSNGLSAEGIKGCQLEVGAERTFLDFYFTFAQKNTDFIGPWEFKCC